MAKTPCNFPSSIDDLSTDRQASQTILSDTIDIIESALMALMAKVGVDESEVATSFDYRINALEDDAHAQDTDTGTTSQAFQLYSGSSGAKLKDNSGIVEIRNSADSAYAHIRPNNIYPLGSTNTPLFTTGNVTYYINPSTGDDDNDGSSGSPFQTIAKAISLIPQIINHNVTINLADGSYSEGISIGSKMGYATITLTGNTTTPADVALTGKINISGNSAYVVISGLETTYTGGDVIYVNTNPSPVALNYLVAEEEDLDYAALSVVRSPIVYANHCALSNHKYGITALTCSRVFSYVCSGSDNTTGLNVSAATIMKGGSVPGGTTAEATVCGGVIR